MFLHLGLIFLLSENVCWLGAVEVIWKCGNITQGVNNGSIKKVKLSSWHMIFPGTLWCGAGNISKCKNELGLHKETDRCCRTHDMCDDIIKSGETRYNLTNSAFYTRLNCKCDVAFYNCLKEANTFLSGRVGFIYFDVLGTQCFRKDYPIKGCIKKAYFPYIRCLEHEYDTNGKKKYQWFDVPIM